MKTTWKRIKFPRMSLQGHATKPIYIATTQLSFVMILQFGLLPLEMKGF